MQNYQQVVHQMQEFGIAFRDRDLPLVIDAPKRRTCGEKGKWWYWLRSFHTDNAGTFIVGRFGSYKSGESLKVDIDWKPLADSELQRLKQEREAALARAQEARAQEALVAAMNAAELWAKASTIGQSKYLERKQVQPESCKFLNDGSIVVPLIRYDWPKDKALRGAQRIRPNGAKLYSKGFDKPGCCVRLGASPAEAWLMIICEGYATGLSIRMAINQTTPVFVALDSGNLQYVVPLLRKLYPATRILIAADDDWKTRDPKNGGPMNVGRDSAMKIAKKTQACDIIFPIFQIGKREDKDTDFNDLHIRSGLAEVKKQIESVYMVHGRRIDA